MFSNAILMHPVFLRRTHGLLSCTFIKRYQYAICDACLVFHFCKRWIRHISSQVCSDSHTFLTISMSFFNLFRPRLFISSSMNLSSPAGLLFLNPLICLMMFPFFALLRLDVGLTWGIFMTVL